MFSVIIIKSTYLIFLYFQGKWGMGHRGWGMGKMREMGRLVLSGVEVWGDGEMGRWGDEFFPSAPCPMPNAQCPMPNDQCPMPNAQCPMPYFSSHKSIDFDS
ncbi:hypothetical protein VF10_26415 [Nostoc linckia z13]|nr:hypothetical protein VF10_26415 [Nostoc linckia z13]